MEKSDQGKHPGISGSNGMLGSARRAASQGDATRHQNRTAPVCRKEAAEGNKTLLLAARPAAF